MGREPPTQEQVREARALPPEQRMGWWRARFGQHCMPHYIDGRCPRADSGRGCAFMHGTPPPPPQACRPAVKHDAPAGPSQEALPSWLEEDLESRGRKV